MNVINKQSRTANKRWFSNGVGRQTNNSTL